MFVITDRDHQCKVAINGIFYSSRRCTDLEASQHVCFFAEIRDICYFGQICQHFQMNCGTSGHTSNWLIFCKITYFIGPQLCITSQTWYQHFYVFHSTLMDKTGKHNTYFNADLHFFINILFKLKIVDILKKNLSGTSNFQLVKMCLKAQDIMEVKGIL